MSVSVRNTFSQPLLHIRGAGTFVLAGLTSEPARLFMERSCFCFLSTALTMSIYIYNTNKVVSIKIELHFLLWGNRFKKSVLSFFQNGFKPSLVASHYTKINWDLADKNQLLPQQLIAQRQQQLGKKKNKPWQRRLDADAAGVAKYERFHRLAWRDRNVASCSVGGFVFTLWLMARSHCTVTEEN